MNPVRLTPIPDPIRKDSEMRFPDFTLVTASAGSGKTTALTRRYLQLILSDKIPFNTLKNVLAITFTNNAASEMKERILKGLKEAAFKIENAENNLPGIISLDKDALAAKAARVVDDILDHFSDFQVQTIDSFITRILKSAAPEFGLPPDFSISIDTTEILGEALALMEREMTSGGEKRLLCAQLADLIGDLQPSDSKYLWNPFRKISGEVTDLYGLLSSMTGEPELHDDAGAMKHEAAEILRCILSIGSIAKKGGFEVKSNFQKLLDLAAEGDLEGVLDKKYDQVALKISRNAGYAAAVEKIETIQAEYRKHVAEYIRLKANAYYQPYIRAHRMLRANIERVKRRRGEVFLGEANKLLAERLATSDIPEIFFSMGERIHHFLIDEFQDTSPVQWDVLRPLIENSLAQEGSLFCVGDTKQSIYTFRGADWRIMRKMLKAEEFPSVLMQPAELNTNWRSTGAIVQFITDLFHKRVPDALGEDREASELSGLALDAQRVRNGAEKSGYVSVRIIPKPDDSDEEEEIPADPDHPPEEKILLETIASCRKRGYSLHDIAVLTPRNSDVVEVSRWLNAAGIRFLSHSSLDIRTRAITGELLSLFRFLDSPIDDLSFATVLLGGIFSRAAHFHGCPDDFRAFVTDVRLDRDSQAPLYTIFRERYADLWSKLFDRLFHRVGYLPVYDLLSEIYALFNCFTLAPDEEATLVKFLEVIRQFEAEGNGSLKDFLAWAGEGESREWNIEVSPSEDAVTIMTIHKAKGLGFPVCITMFYDGVRKTNNRVLSRDGKEVTIVRVKKDWVEKCESLAPLASDEHKSGLVDDLNKLYVALTRAREELYVISIQARRGKSPSLFFPPDGTTFGKPVKKEKEKKGRADGIALLHVASPGFSEEEGEDTIVRGDTARGELIHAILAEITEVAGEPAGVIAVAAKQMRKPASTEKELNDAAKLLSEFVALPAVAPFFTPRQGRKILNEQEITAASGRIFRVDRLILDIDCVTVVDFKTGKKEPGHDFQVRGYCQLAREIWPGLPVKGFLAYIDRRAVEEVK
jgi:ATP-dependent helicase/nuclease subunit A